MKKVLIILALAAITLTASAQGEALKTFDCKLFSCLYPANFEPQEQWMDETFNAKIEDGIEFFSVSINDQDMTQQELKDWGEGMKGLVERSFGEPTGWKAGPVVIKEKQLTFRSECEKDVDDETKEPAVKYTFCVVTPGKKAFTGELTFPKKDEAKYKPILENIFASFKAK